MEICTLKVKVTALSNDLSSFISVFDKISSDPSDVHDCKCQTQTLKSASEVKSFVPPTIRRNPKANLDNYQKFNSVLFNLEEAAQGSPRHKRLLHDMTRAQAAFSTVDSSITNQSIRDCFRLGKYRAGMSHPRPVLIKFNRIADVSLCCLRGPQAKTSCY